MEQNKSIQTSDLIEALYAAAMEPKHYLEFTRVWEEIVIGTLVEGDRQASLRDVVSDAQLSKHFKRALSIFETVRQTRSADADTYLNGLPFGAAIANRRGMILNLNQAFTAQFGVEVGASLSDAGDALDVLSGGEANGDIQDGKRRLIRIQTGEGKQHYLVGEPWPGATPSSGDHDAFLFKSTQLEWHPGVGDLLVGAFNLSVAETEILKSFYAGQDSRAIADARQRSVGTVRQQLKSIMGKLGLGKQSDVLLLLVGLSTTLAATPAKSARPMTVSAASYLTREVRTAKGYGPIDMVAYGRPDGLPVLLIHSQMSSASPTPAMQCAAEAAGLCIYAPLKPGLGETVPEPDGYDPLAFCTAALSLIRQRIDRPLVLIGHGMSGVEGLQLAAAEPSAFERVILLDTGRPLVEREDFECMPPVARRIFWAVKDSFDAFYPPFAFAAEAVLRDSAFERVFMRDQFSDIPHDLALLEDPQMYRYARTAMLDFMRTPERSAESLRFWMSDWTELAETIAKSHDLIFAQSQHHDWQVPSHVHEFARSVGADFNRIPDVAELCMLESPQSIFNLAL